MKIGDVEINGFAVLAPMAGVADRAFREICRSFGAAMTYGELTSSKGISMNSQKSKALLASSESERPFAAQIFGGDPLLMAEAAKQAANLDADIIDINMGCPAPKVIKSGGGSILMKNPKLAGEIVKAVCNAVDKPVTVKIRSGFDSSNINAVEVAKYVEDNGAKAITVHGRTREQMYAPPVNIEIIKKVKESVSIPVIGNGDIYTAFDAAKMYEYTNCDMIMVGRGALGNPHIFTEINAYLESGTVLPPMTVSNKMLTLINQAKKAVEYKGEYIAMREARKHAAYYIKGFKNAALYRNMCSELKTMDDLIKLAYTVSNTEKEVL